MTKAEQSEIRDLKRILLGNGEPENGVLIRQGRIEDHITTVLSKVDSLDGKLDKFDHSLVKQQEFCKGVQREKQNNQGKITVPKIILDWVIKIGVFLILGEMIYTKIH